MLQKQLWWLDLNLPTEYYDKPPSNDFLRYLYCFCGSGKNIYLQPYSQTCGQDLTRYYGILTVQESLLASPPAQTKEAVSSTYAVPKRAACSCDWQVAGATIGTSTFFSICWYWPWRPNIFLPHPATQHLKKKPTIIPILSKMQS